MEASNPRASIRIGGVGLDHITAKSINLYFRHRLQVITTIRTLNNGNKNTAFDCLKKPDTNVDQYARWLYEWILSSPNTQKLFTGWYLVLVTGGAAKHPLALSLDQIKTINQNISNSKYQSFYPLLTSRNPEKERFAGSFLVLCLLFYISIRIFVILGCFFRILSDYR